MSTILITGAGGPAGIALARQFSEMRNRGQHHVVIGTDIVNVDEEQLDDLIVVPPADHPALLPVLRRAAGRIRANLVIPTVADELAAVASVAGLMDVPVVISGARGTALCHDKLLTMWGLEEAGVPVPHYASPSEFSSTAAALQLMEGSLVVKPRVSRGGRGVQLVDQARDLDWTSLDDTLIVQQFAPGVEYAPQVYRSPRTGEVDVVVLEKTGLKQGRVGNATSVVRLRDGEAADVAHLAAQAAHALDLTGPLDMDIRRRSDGVPVVLEINARFGANSCSAPELLFSVLRDYLPEEIA